MMITCTIAPDLSNQEFLLELYQKYGRLMYYTVKKYCSSKQECEDIVQDSLLALVKKVGTLRKMEQRAVASYVVITVRNTAFNHIKHNKVVHSHEIHFEDMAEPQGDLSQLCGKPMEQWEERDAFLCAWVRLSQEEQVLISGKYILGYSDEELANGMHCKPDSIRMKRVRARKKMQLYLEEQEGGTGNG